MFLGRTACKWSTKFEGCPQNAPRQLLPVLNMIKIHGNNARVNEKAAKVTEPTDLLSACQNEIFGKKTQVDGSKKRKAGPTQGKWH